MFLLDMGRNQSQLDHHISLLRKQRYSIQMQLIFYKSVPTYNPQMTVDPPYLDRLRDIPQGMGSKLKQFTLKILKVQDTQVVALYFIVISADEG